MSFKERQQHLTEGNLSDLQQRREEERRKIREEKARLARKAAIQVQAQYEFCVLGKVCCVELKFRSVHMLVPHVGGASE